MSLEPLPPEPVSPKMQLPDADLIAAAPKTFGLERQERRVRDLILDYALGISIIGLIPISGLFTLKLLVAAILLLKLMWDIRKLLDFRRGQDALAIAGNLFGGLGAFAMAFTAWLTFFGIGIFVPYVKGLSLAAALFTLTWGIGQATKQFYASGHERDETR